MRALCIYQQSIEGDKIIGLVNKEMKLIEIIKEILDRDQINYVYKDKMQEQDIKEAGIYLIEDKDNIKLISCTEKEVNLYIYRYKEIEKKEIYKWTIIEIENRTSKLMDNIGNKLITDQLCKFDMKSITNYCKINIITKNEVTSMEMTNMLAKYFMIGKELKIYYIGSKEICEKYREMYKNIKFIESGNILQLKDYLCTITVMSKKQHRKFSCMLVFDNCYDKLYNKESILMDDIYFKYINNHMYIINITNRTTINDIYEYNIIDTKLTNTIKDENKYEYYKFNVKDDNELIIIKSS